MCVRAKHAVEFSMMEKAEVNGPAAHPVYRFLRLAVGTPEEPSPYLGWNFCIFIIGRDGTTVRRPHASESPSSVREQLEALLAEPAPSKHPTAEWLDGSAATRSKDAQ